MFKLLGQLFDVVTLLFRLEKLSSNRDPLLTPYQRIFNNKKLGAEAPNFEPQTTEKQKFEISRRKNRVRRFLHFLAIWAFKFRGLIFDISNLGFSEGGGRGLEIRGYVIRVFEFWIFIFRYFGFRLLTCNRG